MVDNRAADCFYHSLAADPVAAAFSNTRNVTCLFYRGAMGCPFSCAAFFIVVNYFCFPLSCLSERKNIHREALILFFVWLLFFIQASWYDCYRHVFFLSCLFYGFNSNFTYIARTCSKLDTSVFHEPGISTSNLLLWTKR